MAEPESDMYTAPSIRSGPGRAPETVVAFRTWRLDGDVLRSRFTETVWEQGELRAQCLPRTPEDLARPRHRAPHPECHCGIHAGFSPDLCVCGVDASAVIGIVHVGGRIVLDAQAARCEHARVVALATYPHWSRRQRAAAAAAAATVGCELVEMAELHDLAVRLGDLPTAPRLRTLFAQSADRSA